MNSLITQATSLHFSKGLTAFIKLYFFGLESNFGDESCVGFLPIRNGEIFRMNNNDLSVALTKVYCSCRLL